MTCILRNAIECRYCGLVLESLHRHDYREHTCKKGPIVGFDREWQKVGNTEVLVETDRPGYPWMMVDGGREYIRRSADSEHFIDRSEYVDDNATKSHVDDNATKPRC